MTTQWDGKVRWHTPCPWPNERITITHTRYSVRVSSDKRTCYGAEHVYLSGCRGHCAPNYPVPAIRHRVEILPCSVFYYENEGNRELIVYLANTNPEIWG